MFKTLIIDDNEAIRRILNQTLSARFPRMTITEAADARNALTILEREIPDLILLDIKLPDGNGIGLARDIKEKHPGIILIIITAYDLPEYRYAASSAGANHFVPKEAFMSEDILSLIEFIVHAKE